jgi:hypothetical protein
MQRYDVADVDQARLHDADHVEALHAQLAVGGERDFDPSAGALLNFIAKELEQLPLRYGARQRHHFQLELALGRLCEHVTGAADGPQSSERACGLQYGSATCHCRRSSSVVRLCQFVPLQQLVSAASVA